MTDTFQTSIRMTEGGRIVIPAEARERLGVAPGSELVLIVEGNSATLLTPKAARQRAQALVAKYIKPGTPLSKELMSERRREAARE